MFSGMSLSTDSTNLLLDPCWVTFAEQYKIVTEYKAKIEALKSQLDSELASPKLPAEAFAKLVSEYETLLKQQRSFTQQLLNTFHS